jgi:peptidoglycan hydrolase CwlO-like protein
MKLLVILQTLSATGAIIVFSVLVLVAALIGYLTAWFYAKSVYTPVIKALEADNTSLKKQVTGLKDNISERNKKVDDLKDKTVRLEEEIRKKEKEIKNLAKEKI